eukprot:GHVL01019762.1.p1 GENE.GHVL01019762.1~~GHVL01019762.1.p1  ORF type:complete len:298 (-),score=78.58 GHVL01019762.1:122-1015(-)
MYKILLYIFLGIVFGHDSVDLLFVAKGVQEADILSIDFEEIRKNLDKIQDISHENVYENIDEIDNECKHCIVNVGDHIIEVATKAWHNACLKPCCDNMKRTCEWAEKHPRFMKGVIIERTKAMEIAAAYCYGADKCPHTPTYDSQNNILQNKISDIIKDIDIYNMYCDRPLILDILDDNKKSQCLECIECRDKHIMQHVYKEVKKECENPKNEHMKKFCHYLYMDPIVGEGWLASHVAPWKYSIGLCMGIKKCHKFPHCLDGDCDGYENNENIYNEANEDMNEVTPPNIPIPTLYEE